MSSANTEAYSNTTYAQYFMDAELNHSSGYFADDHVSLDSAQQAKIRAILDQCRLQPGMKLLDVGCGWGAAARMAASEYRANVTGITLDREQLKYALERERSKPIASRIDFRLQPWEDFDEPVDRIICINAFENFTDKSSFLPHCRSLLPAGGVIVMLTVTADRPIFRVISKQEIIDSGDRAGFEVHVSDSLAAHYVRTLECFIDRIRGRREEIVSLAGADRVDGDIAFYSQCAGFLRRGLNDMFEFTFIARLPSLLALKMGHY
jgi:cyclopropane-fatty-acyl-phospholipid synthase